MLNDLIEQLLLSVASLFAWGVGLFLLILALAFWPVTLCLLALAIGVVIIKKVQKTQQAKLEAEIQAQNEAAQKAQRKEQIELLRAAMLGRAAQRDKTSL